MNRKLVKGLLLLSVATVGCGTFTSCKDTDEDFNTGIIAGQVDLADKIKALQTAVDNIKSCACPDVNKLINDMKADLVKKIEKGDSINLDSIRDVATTLAALEADVKTLDVFAHKTDSLLGDLKNSVYDKDSVNAKIDALNLALTNQITTLKTTLSSALNDSTAALRIELTNLGTALNRVKGDLTVAQDSIIANATKLVDHANRIKALEDQYNYLNDLLNGVGGAAGIVQDVNDLNAWMDENKAKYDQAVTDITGALDDIDALYGLVQRNSALITDLQNKVSLYFSSLTDRLNKLITGILVNQTYNPIFGTINLPIGMQSIVLANYYGYTTHPVNFPMDFNHEAYSSQDALAGLGIENVVTKLKNEPVVIAGGDKYMDMDANNLGQLYLTINPNNVAFDGVKLDLVKSTGDKAPISLTTKSTDEELTFGWTRSDVKNGFYRSEAYIKPDDAPSILVNIEPGLKSAAKNLIKNPSKSTVADFGKILIDQLDGFLPAYAVRATWNADETQADGSKKAVEYAVYSKYEVAATAFRPLGYESLSDVSTSRELPIFDPVTE